MTKDTQALTPQQQHPTALELLELNDVPEVDELLRDLAGFEAAQATEPPSEAPDANQG